MCTQVAVFGLDDKGRISDWNARAAATFDVAESEAMGQTFDKIILHRQGPRFPQILSRKLQHGQAEPWFGFVRLGSIAKSSGVAEETSFNVATFCNSVDGRANGAICLATPDVASQAALPIPVGGVVAWRCSL